MASRGAPKGNSNRKGKLCKKSLEVAARLEEIGCDPIIGMAEIAADARAAGDNALAGAMYKELAQYVAPKRKAIEITGENGADIFPKKITFEIIDGKHKSNPTTT